MGILFGILIILVIVIVNNEKEMDRLIKENRELKKSLEYFTEKTKEKSEESKDSFETTDLVISTEAATETYHFVDVYGNTVCS